jgi:uncharacterized protein (TIGR02284 family)
MRLLLEEASMLPIHVTAQKLEEMPIHDQKNVEATLQELAITAVDAARGYDLAAIRTKVSELRALFEHLASQRRGHALALSAMMHESRRGRATEGSLLGTLHRGIMELRAKLHHGDVATLVTECERGEYAALKRYDLALQERLPQDVANLLLDQATEIRDLRAAFDGMRKPW